MNTKILILASLLLIAIAATATVPNDWATGNYHVPQCSAQVNVKHYEISVGTQDPNGIVQGYDALRAKGYTNLQYRIPTTGQGIWSGDCALAS